MRIRIWSMVFVFALCCIACGDEEGEGSSVDMGANDTGGADTIGTDSAEDTSESPDSSADAVEVVDLESYEVEAGSSVMVDSTMVIRVAGDVNIAGNIGASGTNGASITIEADGDIVVTGTLQAGDGGTGVDGGSVVLVSTGGDIVLTGSTVAAGDGSEGEPGAELAGGAGSDGGDVVLRAPAGTLTLSGEVGSIHIGNGGDATSYSVQGEALLTSPAPGVMQNRGGNSGRLEVEAGTIIGITFETMTLVEDSLGSDGEVFYAAGDILIPTETDAFTGGEGGDAGDLAYGMDADGNSTWPDASLKQDQQPNLDITGTDGGNGLFSGGNGGNLTATGAPGMGAGGKGQTVVVTGTRGGNCFFPLCTTGRAGRIRATGGRGANGADPSGTGGDGGDARVWPGVGGILSDTAKCGNSTAIGGAGGTGGDGCGDTPGVSGGAGGDGGEAYLGGTATAYCTTFGVLNFTGGAGGEGGGGQETGGAGGAGGGTDTTAEPDEVPAVFTPGQAGSVGRTCPVAPSTCKCADEGVTVEIVSGCSNWPDATECGGFHSTWCEETMPIDYPVCAGFSSEEFSSGDSFTYAGCTIKITCP